MKQSTVFTCLVIILYLPGNQCYDVYGRQWWDHWVYSGAFPGRIYHLMKEHYEDIARKIELIFHIRITYEESWQYELGYIMGEIIERYHKMVEHLKRPMQYPADAVYDTLKRIQLMQTLYLEIYHLTNMMHEIPRKYGLKDDGSKPVVEKKNEAEEFDNNKRAYEAQEKLKRDREERLRNKKKRLKEMKKLRELMLKGQYHVTKTRRPKNKWWPIDYGWEIDYYW